MTISIRLNKEDTELFRKYAELNHMSLSDMIRNAVLEKIENEYDLKCYEEAIMEYKKNPVIYRHEEVAKILELE